MHFSSAIESINKALVRPMYLQYFKIEILTSR